MDTSTSTLTRSPYEILKINRWASEEEIKSQYFHLVKQYNPEYFPDEFIEIRTAYELLKDPSNKATTDVAAFAPPPSFRHSDYPEFPEQPLSLFKLNQELKTVCGEAAPEQMEGENRPKVLHSLRGMALYQAYHNNLEEAKSLWKRALAMHPENTEIKENLALVSWLEGYNAATQDHFPDAEKSFQQIVEAGFQHGVIYQNLALSREKQGKKSETDEAWRLCLNGYKQELREDPNNPYLQALVVSIHKYTGGKFLEGGGSTVLGGGIAGGSAKELGYACIQQGNWKQAVEALEQALRENEDDIDVLCQLGWAYLNTSKHNQAFHMWHLALKKAPGKHQVIDHLVRGHSIFGKRLKEQRIYNQALVQFKNALKYEPGNIEMRTLLADTYFQMRNFSAASQEYQRILDIEPRNKEAKQGIRESKRLGGLR